MEKLVSQHPKDVTVGHDIVPEDLTQHQSAL